MDFKVSVIIPVFNAEPYIRSAVQSALALDHTGEIIMVEDGSTDGSLEACRDLLQSDDRLVLLCHNGGGNHGAAATRNVGIENARFPFVTFLDADDIYAENRFAVAARIFAERPDCEGVYEAIGMLPTDDSRNKPLITTVKEPYTGDELFFKLSPIGNRGYFSLIGLTVRKSVFAKAGMLNETLRVSQDTEWMIRLTACCELCPGSISEPVSLRRIHGANRTTDEAFMRSKKPLMALACLDWFVKNDMPADKTAEVLRLYLKYRFEHINLSGRGNRLWRKWRDVADGLAIWIRYPALRSNKFLKYHLRLAFKLPVSKHLNYYVGR
ncbi:MAG: glycosyltransferase family 2 protein [Cryomorphaceae bacterium]